MELELVRHALLHDLGHYDQETLNLTEQHVPESSVEPQAFQ